jgi:rubredoxin
MDPRSVKRRKRRLIEGRNMRCPRCKKLHDILKYVPMKQIEEFSEETTPCYKCPSCRWIFAPADPLVIALGPPLEAGTYMDGPAVRREEAIV